MKTSEFAALSIDHKCALVWRQGLFLANYVEQCSICTLYFLDCFLVEIIASTANAQISSVIIVDPPGLDTLYSYVRQLVLPLDDSSTTPAP